MVDRIAYQPHDIAIIPGGMNLELELPVGPGRMPMMVGCRLSPLPAH